jgi:hypothetical protein
MSLKVKTILAALLLPALSIFAQTTVTPTVWPTASEVTYGSILQQVLLIGGECTIDGSYAFENPSTRPAAGTAGYNVIFTPTDTVSYNSVTGSVSVTIQKRVLYVSGAAVTDKTYDRATTAEVTGGSLVNVVSGDDVSIMAKFGYFQQPGAGNDIPVYSVFILGGAAAGNYSLVSPDLTGNILQKGLVVTSAVAQDKTYDGTTDAVITGAQLSGVVAGDDVTLSNSAAGTFTQSDAGSSIEVTPAMTLAGSSASNYSLTQPVGLSADILNASQTISDFLPANGTNLLITSTNEVSATATSGFPVMFEIISGPAEFTAETNLYFTGAGDVVLAATQGGNVNWNAISQTNTLTVSKVAQSISSFLPGSGNTFAVSDSVGLSAVASSGLDVSFAVGSGSASISGGTNLTFSSEGTVTVVATQAGDGRYETAAPVTNSYTVQAGATVTLSDLSYTYDGSSHSATVTTDPSGLVVDVTYNGSASIPVNAGTYEVIATLNEAFYQGSMTNSLVIAKAMPDLSGLSASSVGYGATLEEVFLNRSSGGVAGTFAFENPSVVPPVGTAAYTVIFTPTDTVNYNSVTSSVSVTVQVRVLYVTGAGVAAKTYDGTTLATISGATLSNAIDGDDVALTNAVGYFSQANVGSGLSIVPFLFLTGTDAGNYSLQQPSGLTGNIIVKALTVTDAIAQNKTYDGTTAAVISGAALSGVVDGDDVSLVAGSAGTFAQSNVGTGIAVSTSMTLGGSDKANYTLTQPAGLSADIAKADQALSAFLPADGTSLLVTSTNGLRAAAYSGLPVTFSVLSGAAALSDGSNLTFSAAGTVTVEASQSGNANWNAAVPVTNTYTVDKASATVTLSGLSYTYDESNHAATVETVPAGLPVDVSYDGAANVPVNAGTYIVVATINDPLYQGSATNNLIITKAAASVSLSDLAYTYDGTAHAATATTLPAGLTVVVTYNGSASEPTNVGTYQVIATVSDSNYQGAATNELVISRATPVLSNLSASEIPYGQLLQQSILTGDAGGVAGSLAFASPAQRPDAGTNNYNVVFTPTDSASYNSVTGSVSVAVQPRSLSVTGAAVADKTYDGTRSAVLTGGSLSNVVSGDDVSLTSRVGQFSQAGVGTGLPVIASLELTGSKSGNYVLLQPAGLTGTILIKELTVGSPSAQNKFYDGTTVAVVAGVVLDGVVDGDDVSLADASVGVFAQSDIGTGIAVTSSMTLSGSDKNNYTLTKPTGLTADILKAAQSISDFLPANGANLLITATNTLSAAASSGGAVTFAVVSGSAAIADGTSLTFSGVGEVKVSATQAGDDNWDAVAVTNTFTVIHDSPVVNLTTITRSSGDAGIKIVDLDIFANCTDPEGSAMTISLPGTSSTNGGTVAISGHWIFFTPKAGSDATDRFPIRITNAFGRETLGWVEVRVETPAVRGLNYLNLEVVGRNAVLDFVGIPGRNYTVQIKTNITQGVWQNLTDVTVDLSGYATAIHTNPPSPCFYRMVE